jgi:very-short-patch-repair endonuclease
MKVLKSGKKCSLSLWERAGVRAMSKGLTNTARMLRKNQTDAERALWHRLRNRRLLGVKFRRQVPIKGYVADFAALEIKLIIELDGSQHIDNKEADEIRTGFLQREGYKVIRFWNNDVLLRLDDVLEFILQAVSCRQSDVENCPLV